MEIDIFKMTLSDFEEISPILSSNFDDFWSINTLKGELENPSSSYFIAKINKEIVGFAGVWRSVDDIHITDIVVKKDLRNHGIGSLLLEKLIDLAKLEKFKFITLEVNTKNTLAQKLYLKYNFKEVGIRKNYYKTEDAIIMTLNLI